MAIPLVVRLTGTNADQGKKMLQEFNKSSKLTIVTADDLDDAAQKAVKTASDYAAK